MDQAFRDLLSSDLSLRKQALILLIANTKSFKGVIPIPNSARFYLSIEDCINNSNSEISYLTLQLLEQLLVVNSKQDFSPTVQGICDRLLPSLVNKLIETQPDFCKCILNVFTSYVCNTKNLDGTVDILIRFGLQNRNPKVQCEALKFIVPLIKLDLNFMQTYDEFGRLVEFILSLVKSSNSIVCDTAIETVLALNELKFDFERITNRLTPSYKQLLTELTSYNSARNLQNTLVSSSTVLSSLTPHSTSINTKSDDLNILPYSNGLMFGFIPQNTLSMLEDLTNWKTRADAMQEIETSFFRITDLKRIEPHMSIFCKYLLCLIDDKNFKISLSSLNLLKRILSFDGIASSLDLTSCINLILSKLGDNKIAIRQSAATIYKRLIYQADPNLLFPKLISGLESSNWHIREEVLNVLITAILNPPKESYDFLTLTPHIAKLLDDPKTKVRFIASEAMAAAVKRCGLENVNRVLEPILDENLYKQIQDRFICNQAPVLKNEFIDLTGSIASIESSERSYNSKYTNSSPFEESVRKEKSTDKLFNRPSMLFASNCNNVCTTSSRSTNDSSRDLKTRGKHDVNTGEETPYFGNRSDGNTAIKPIKFFRHRNSLLDLKSEQPRSLKPPSFPINISTKSSSGNSRLSFGYVQHHRKKHLAPLTKLISPMKRHSSLDNILQSPVAKSINSTDLPPSSLYISQKPELDFLLTISNISSPTSLCAPLLSPTGLSMHPIYIDREDLLPLSNPQQELTKLLSNSNTSTDLEMNSDYTTTIRRLLKYHRELLSNNTHVNSIVSEAIKWMESIRSSIAKNGMIVIEEMAIALGDRIDNELDIICRSLIVKASDVNHFIADTAEKTLNTICVYCGDARIVVSIENAIKIHQSSRLKAVAARCFNQIFEGNSGDITRLKELSKMLNLLNDFSTDASIEVREASKQAILTFKASFSSEADLNKILCKYLDNFGIRRYSSIPNFEKTAEFKSLRSSSVVENTPKSSLHEKQDIKSAGGKMPHIRIRASNGNLQIPEFDRIASIITEINSKEWKLRLSGLSKLEDLVTKHGADLQSSTKILTVFDCFAKLMSDTNLKVNIHALESFNLAIPKLVDALETCLPVVIGSIMYNASSSNSVVRDLAIQVCDTLRLHCSAVSMIAPLCSALLASNLKSRLLLLRTLCEIVPYIPDQKSMLIKKHLVPILYKLLDDPNLEIRDVTIRLIRVVYNSISSWLIEKVPAGKLPKLLEALQ